MAQLEGRFAKLFKEHLNEIELRALRAGTNLTAICRELSISRSTPDRWRRKLPRTIVILDEIDRSVSEVEKSKSKSGRAATSNA